MLLSALSEEKQGLAQFALGVLLIVAMLAWWKTQQAGPDEQPVLTAAADHTPSGEGEGSSDFLALGALAVDTEAAAAPAEAPPPEFPEEPEGSTPQPPCHQGINLPPGWRVLTRCFPAREVANDIVHRLREVNLHATTEKSDMGVYAVRYQPITEAEARAEGNAALALRKPRGSDIYQLDVRQDKRIDSYGWRITMPCPTGWHDSGSFKLTAYVLAQERDFPAKPKIKDPCGLKGTYPHKFLFGEGVRLQGSGITSKGQIIHFKGKNCFEELDCPVARIGRCAQTNRTIAVDPKVISLGSEVLIEDIGYRIAEDTGGAIRGAHIDVYYGTSLRLRQAWAHTRENRKVCVKPREMAL